LSLVEIADRLRADVTGLDLVRDPVTHVYNPLEYAWEPHQAYLTRYGSARRAVVLVGMNPGPWGMAQTGVPFGDVTMVRDWLGIDGRIGRPLHEHPKRPVEGFACRRSEVSGHRLWGWARRTFGTPERFFARFFVLNYCPLCFMEASGRNRTPDKLPAGDRDVLYPICDAALRAAVECLAPDHVLGVGGFAAGRATASLHGMGVRVGQILHPSPANPRANRDWVGEVEAVLHDIGALPDESLLTERK
jgi:single-strand selective monofunctional uracil DNA glycosylase